MMYAVHSFGPTCHMLKSQTALQQQHHKFWSAFRRSEQLMCMCICVSSMEVLGFSSGNQINLAWKINRLQALVCLACPIAVFSVCLYIKKKKPFTWIRSNVCESAGLCHKIPRRNRKQMGTLTWINTLSNLILQMCQHSSNLWEFGSRAGWCVFVFVFFFNHHSY